MNYLGDFRVEETVHFVWNTNGADGASITRGTNGTISVHKNVDTSQFTTGVTDTEDYDGNTGTHAVTIVTTNATYTPSNYSVVLVGAVIDTITVNAVIAEFSIQNRYYAGLIARGVLQSATATTAVLAAATSFANDLINGATLVLVHGTGKGQSRLIDDWQASVADTATVATWTTTPDNTTYYEVYATPPASSSNPLHVDVTHVLGTELEIGGDAPASPIGFV